MRIYIGLSRVKTWDYLIFQGLRMQEKCLTSIWRTPSLRTGARPSSAPSVGSKLLFGTIWGTTLKAPTSLATSATIATTARRHLKLRMLFAAMFPEGTGIRDFVVITCKYLKGIEDWLIYPNWYKFTMKIEIYGFWPFPPHHLRGMILFHCTYSGKPKFGFKGFRGALRIGHRLSSWVLPRTNRLLLRTGGVGLAAGTWRAVRTLCPAQGGREGGSGRASADQAGTCVYARLRGGPTIQLSTTFDLCF